jgi:hypothetical protein
MFCDRIRDAERGMYCSPYLDNDVLDTVSHAKALALDNTLVALTNQTLVGVDSDTNHTGLVVSQGRDLLVVRSYVAIGELEVTTNLRCLGFVVLTPAILVDGLLAKTASTPGRATLGRGGALSTAEVEGLIEDNNTRLAVTKVRDQLGSGGRIHSSDRTASSDALCETFSSTSNASSADGTDECCKSRCEESKRSHDRKSDRGKMKQIQERTQMKK